MELNNNSSSTIDLPNPNENKTTTSTKTNIVDTNKNSTEEVTEFIGDKKNFIIPTTFNAQSNRKQNDNSNNNNDLKQKTALQKSSKNDNVKKVEKENETAILCSETTNGSSTTTHCDTTSSTMFNPTNLITVNDKTKTSIRSSKKSNEKMAKYETSGTLGSSNSKQGATDICRPQVSATKMISAQHLNEDNEVQQSSRKPASTNLKKLKDDRVLTPGKNEVTGTTPPDSASDSDASNKSIQLRNINPTINSVALNQNKIDIVNNDSRSSSAIVKRIPFTSTKYDELTK